MTVEPGLRERKKLATRRAVAEAALRLAVRHGVERVTVEQIAAEADVALRTFFNHFPSKEDAVVAAAVAGAEALVAEVRVRPAAEPPLAAVREAALAVMQREDAASRDHLVALRLMRTSPSLVPRQMAVLTAQERALAAAIAERVGPGPYPALCAAAALAALRVVLDRWLGAAEPDREALRTEVDAAFALLAGGL
jgi:AcrR family transcriptional regulator